MSKIAFEKHVYGREKRKSFTLLENFDPRPSQYKGQAANNLALFIEKVKGRNLGVSLLFDAASKLWADEDSVGTPTVITQEQLLNNISAFKESLKLPASELRKIERETKDQSRSPYWYSVRKYRITASYFGEIFKRLPSTHPHHLVLRIIDPKPFKCAATDWGKAHESCALEQYMKYQKDRGNTNLVISSAGFVISESYPFLGASPDGYVYDPSSSEPFGLVEIKCPYKFRGQLLTEASLDRDFYCDLEIQPSGDPIVKLKWSHPYYCQVQGQLAIAERTWCDFVVYTTKGISVERIVFDQVFWENQLLP